MLAIAKIVISWSVGVLAMMDFRDFAQIKATSTTDPDGHAAFILRKVSLKFDIIGMDFNKTVSNAQLSADVKGKIQAGIAADVAGIEVSDISVEFYEGPAATDVSVEAAISTKSTGRSIFETEDALQSSSTLGTNLLSQLNSMDLSVSVTGTLSTTSFSAFVVTVGQRPAPNPKVTAVPHFIKFLKPDMAPASFIYSLNQNNPPYIVDNVTLPSEPFPGCDAKYATVCAVQNAIRLVTQAKAGVCGDLQAGGSQRKAALKKISDDGIKLSGATGFGVVVFEKDGTILADSLKPDFAGYPIDGYLASALVAQPTLLDHVDWVVSYGGGFVPHYTTRITSATVSEMVAVFSAPQSVYASMYVEECASGERIGVAFGREPLPAVETCSPNYNGLCAVQNIRRLVGRSLVDFLNAKDFQEVDQQNHEISYGGGTGKYSVGVFYSMRYLMGDWGYPVGGNRYRNPAPLGDTGGTCFAIGGGLTKSINGRNATWLPGSPPAAVKAQYPDLKRGDWLLAEMSKAAYEGGAWQDYEWFIPALGDHYKVSLIVGVVWNGTATYLATGTVHIPTPPASGPTCTQCKASESLPCATLTAERLAGHAFFEMLTPKGNWTRISNDPWFGADHTDMWTNDANKERWPTGFYVFAFNYNGRCVADGHTPSNVGKTWSEIYAGTSVDASGIDAKFKFAADNGGGWISFKGKDGLDKLAFVQKMSKNGAFDYMAVSISMTHGSLDMSCSAAHAEACSERNAEKLVGAANAEILAAQDTAAFDQVLKAITDRTGSFATASAGDFKVEVFDSEWQCVTNSSGATSEACIASFTNEQKTILDALASGSWGQFLTGAETKEYVYVMHVPFKLSHKMSSSFLRDIRLLLRVQPAYQPGRCSQDSDCPANARCGSDSLCSCDASFAPRYSVNSSICGELPNAVMQCVDVKGLGCPTCPPAGCLVGFQCQACQAGFYCPEGFQEACPAGQYCEANSWQPTPCPEGTYSSMRKGTSINDCTPCPAGAIAISPGKTECTECGLGEIAATIGSTICDQCSRGTYASERGMSQCSTCVGALTTESMASRYASDCACPMGQYRSSTDRLQCLNCEEGMTCAWGADAHLNSTVSPILKPGFWSSKDDPLNVFRCKDEKRCIGGNPVTDTVCSSNMKDSRACERCQDDWIWDGDKCSECDSFESSPVMFPLLPILLVPVVIIILYKLFKDPHEKWGSWGNGFASIGFVALNHYQIISLTPNIDMLPPSQFRSVQNSFGWTGDASSIFKIACTGFGDFKSGLILKATAPAFLGIMYILVWASSQVVAKLGKPDLAMEKNRTLNGYFSIMFTFFAGICGASFELFKCSPNPNGEKTLAVDRSVICGSDEWNSMLIVAILAILLWVVGFGALFLRALCMSPDNFKDPLIQMRWKFLFIKFRPDVHWWAIVVVLKGIILNLMFIVCETAMGQINFMLFTITGYICLLVAFQPWRHVYINGVDFWAHMCLLLLGAVLMWFASADTKTNAKIAQNDQEVMGVIMCFFIIPSIFPVAFHLWWTQESSSQLQTREKSAALVHATFKFVGKIDEAVFTKALAQMGEWDRNYLMKAHDVVEEVFIGNQKKSRYDAGALCSQFSNLQNSCSVSEPKPSLFSEAPQPEPDPSTTKDDKIKSDSAANPSPEASNGVRVDPYGEVILSDDEDMV